MGTVVDLVSRTRYGHQDALQKLSLPSYKTSTRRQVLEAQTSGARAHKYDSFPHTRPGMPSCILARRSSCVAGWSSAVPIYSVKTVGECTDVSGPSSIGMVVFAVVRYYGIPPVPWPPAHVVYQ